MKKGMPNRPLDFKRWFLLWNHGCNPFGNWLDRAADCDAMGRA